MATRSSGADSSPKALAASVRPADRRDDQCKEDRGEERSGCERAERRRAGGGGEAECDEHGARVPGDEALGNEAGREVRGGRGRRSSRPVVRVASPYVSISKAPM